jgi:hypothetical protein
LDVRAASKVSHLLICLLLLWTPKGWATSNAIIDHFLPTTPVETLVAPFTTGGVRTINAYSGLVEIHVSGTGQGAGNNQSDAFYAFERPAGGPITPDPSIPHLALSFSSDVCSNPPLIEAFMAFIDGVGTVSTGTVPPYSPVHNYAFVINLGSFNGQITLGFKDCGFSDNQGAFQITVNGVQAGTASLEPWQFTTPLQVPRNGHGMAATGTHVYALGGANNVAAPCTTLASVEAAPILSDGSLGAWTFTRPLSFPRFTTRAVIVGNFLYVVGGADRCGLVEAVLFGSVERAAILSDGTLGPWLVVASLTRGRAHMAVVTDGGRLYAIGGFDGSRTNTVEMNTVLPDGSLTPWQLVTPMATGREAPGAGILNGMVYAAGGLTPGGIVATTEAARIQANGTLGAWQTMAPMGTARYQAVGVTAGNTLRMIGGGPQGAGSPTTERAILDGAGAIAGWTPDASMHQSRVGPGAAISGNHIYTSGGDLAGLDSSVEFTDDGSASAFVTRLYLQVLSRAPDQAGLQAFVQQIQQFGSVVPTVLAFFHSPEFLARNTSDAEFLTICYRTFLNREPDPAGFTAFLTTLQAGQLTRDNLLDIFIDSAEFAAQASFLPPLDPVTAFVTNLYVRILGRGPDQAGLTGFVTQLNQTRTVLPTVQLFLNSPEFLARNTTNTEFVTLLYRVFLDRVPDAPGLTSWVALLNQGTATRDQLAAQFAASAEFQIKLNQLFP